MPIVERSKWGEIHKNIIICYFSSSCARLMLNSIRNQTIKFYGVVFIIKFISGFFLSIFPPLSGKIALTLPRLCASICECLRNDVKLQISRILKARAFLCVEVF